MCSCYQMMKIVNIILQNLSQIFSLDLVQKPLNQIPVLCFVTLFD